MAVDPDVIKVGMQLVARLLDIRDNLTEYEMLTLEAGCKCFQQVYRQIEILTDDQNFRLLLTIAEERAKKGQDDELESDI